MLRCTGNALHSREAAFHDTWASETKLDDILVRECFEAPTAMENQFILQRMGDLHGKKLLDIGAGLGESSVYFALRGAEVTTVDISPQMVETALKLGARFGVKLQGLGFGRRKSRFCRGGLRPYLCREHHPPCAGSRLAVFPDASGFEAGRKILFL